MREGRYNPSLHLNPGCCRFPVVTVEQFDFAGREGRHDRMDTAPCVSVRTELLKIERLPAPGQVSLFVVPTNVRG
jgi:hypothetical protein